MIWVSFCSYYTESCCSQEMDTAIAELHAQLKDGNKENRFYHSPENGFPSISLEHCLDMLKMLLCQPCAPVEVSGLQPCGLFCDSLQLYCAELNDVSSIDDLRKNFSALQNVTYINPLDSSLCTPSLSWWQLDDRLGCFNGSETKFLSFPLVALILFWYQGSDQFLE
eukprot:TRINITY_DN10912_c0_g1_i6.p1 TRINITY_DN10912_c0_g1~~TRINITY_DN10912_c0_g1_i6.p1  ORF type:complete len:167 (-),score=12.28 TRINITY_DN10912_c0_g1_i6:169-669(-)